VQNDFPAVGIRSLPPQQLLALQTVHQLHSAVMAQLHALGKFTNRGRAARGQASQSQKK
jgi:hypothetical protein